MLFMIDIQPFIDQLREAYFKICRNIDSEWEWYFTLRAWEKTGNLYYKGYYNG